MLSAGRVNTVPTDSAFLTSSLFLFSHWHYSFRSDLRFKAYVGGSDTQPPFFFGVSFLSCSQVSTCVRSFSSSSSEFRGAFLAWSFSFSSDTPGYSPWFYLAILRKREL